MDPQVFCACFSGLVLSNRRTSCSRRWFRSSVVALLALVVGVMVCADDKKEEKKITKDQVPMSVITAFEKAYPNATVNEYTQKTRGEKVWYSIEFVDGGITKEVKYAADGTLHGSRSDVVARDLPEAVRKYHRRKVPGAEIVRPRPRCEMGSCCTK